MGEKKGGGVSNETLNNVFDCTASLKSVIIPPLGVFMKKGCECEFWVSVGLTILGYIPGVVYSLYVVTDSIKHDPPFFPEEYTGPPPNPQPPQYPQPAPPSARKEQ